MKTRIRNNTRADWNSAGQRGGERMTGNERGERRYGAACVFTGGGESGENQSGVGHAQVTWCSGDSIFYASVYRSVMCFKNVGNDVLSYSI